MILIPLHDNVLVRRHDKEEVSAGGLILAASAVEKPRLGTVVAVGPGKTISGKFIASVVQEGDTVLFGKTSGYEVKVGDEKLLMMPEGEIYATIKERV